MSNIGPLDEAKLWRETSEHRAFLRADIDRQAAFFRRSLRSDGGFDTFDLAGRPLGGPQELHTTTRLVHSFALIQAITGDGGEIVEAGLRYLWDRHRDADHGGYLWSVSATGEAQHIKLAYGHVFVLLAASSAMQAGHSLARALFEDVAEVLEHRFWDPDKDRFQDEFARDWTPFSSYRGMNANMHGVEALIAAYEATGESLFLTRAAAILEFFTKEMAAANGWRIPEHYDADWKVDRDYAGDPMFRPPGTTPGHALEWARLLLQHWDLSGRCDPDAPARARRLVETALRDGWREDGGLAYTVDFDGAWLRRDRYWWPVTEAIGAVAALQKAAPEPEDELWYRRLWGFASEHLIDHGRGGWYPELDESGKPTGRQFEGKPDIYHALQAALLPLLPGLSRPFDEIATALR